MNAKTAMTASGERRIAKHAFAATILMLCFAAPAAAQGRQMHQNFLDANAALDRGEYPRALRLYHSVADYGYIHDHSVADYGYIHAQEAQERLGFMYDTGMGVTRDYAEAMRWYRLAADEGYPVAQWEIGDMYEEGHGVPQDYVEAVRWYRKAADQELPVAQYSLGFMASRRTTSSRTCGSICRPHTGTNILNQTNIGTKSQGA
jgi:TPR repeat protein